MPIESPIYDPEDDQKPMSPTDRLSSYILRSCSCIAIAIAVIALGFIALLIKGAVWPVH